MKIKIANKLFAFFLLVAMVPLATVCFLAHRQADEANRKFPAFSLRGAKLCG